MGKSRRDVGKGRDDKAALMCGFESAPSPFHGSLSVFQRIADTPANKVDGCSKNSPLRKTAEG